jgi:hypothetical protein
MKYKTELIMIVIGIVMLTVGLTWLISIFQRLS